MTTKVKGLFKGFKHISQIFDEKEDDIQIGLPTNVKHVAHIGMDGPSASTPTWMNEFKTAPEGSKPAPAEAPINSVQTQGDIKISKDSKQKKNIPKSRHASLESNNTDSPIRESSDGSKHVRRHRSSDPSSECSARDSTSSDSRQSRKARSTNPEAASKPGRRRKTKTTSIDETEKKERSSRRSSKGNSMTDISSPELDNERKKSED